MSSLLTRRRVLTAIAADQVEGGGPNDGRYVAVADSSSQGYRWVSTDFGMSYGTKISATYANSYPSASFYIDCSGSLYYGGYNLSTYRGSVNYPANTYYANGQSSNLIRTTNNTVFLSASAFTSNKQGNFFALMGKNTISILQKVTQSTYGVTASVVKSISLPSDLQVRDNPQGSFLEADDSFTHIIVSRDDLMHWGRGWNSAYVSHDGGTTWTNMLTAVSSDSQSKEGVVRGIHMSKDGKYCAVVIWENPGGVYVDNYLYLSKNYGSSFEQLSFPSNYEPQGIQASEKFGTMYATAINRSNHYAALLKSVNKGKSWTVISQSSAVRDCPMLLCNAKGDKIVTAAMSGSLVGNSQVLYYSHDYGETWTANTTRLKARPGSGNVTRYAMSRDYISNQQEGYQYSMSLAEAQSALYQAVNTGTGTLRVSVDGYTLVSSKLTSYTDNQSYPGYSLFNVEDLPTVSGQSGPQLRFAYNSSQDTYGANVGIGWGVNSSDTSGDFLDSSQATNYAVDILINRLVGLAGNNPIYVSYSTS